MHVNASTLREFASNVLDPLTANFNAVNGYVNDYCQGVATASSNPGSLEPDGSTGAVAQAVNLAAKNLVSNYHEYITPGARHLGETASALRSTASYYQKHDDDNAQQIWTVGHTWRTSRGYTQHHANGTASGFVSGSVATWSASDHTPKARAQISDTLTDTHGIAAWIDDMLSELGLERIVVDALKFVVGDYGIPWRNSDAWGHVVDAFHGMSGALKRWTPVLSDQWSGAGGTAFDYDIFDRWCPALNGASRVAYASQQQMQALASAWQSVYETTINLIDWTAGLIKNAIRDILGIVFNAEKVAELWGEIKGKWDSAMQMANDVVDMARNITNAATSAWNIQDLYIYKKSPLDTLQYDDYPA